jgi:hypothetical protein
MRRVELGIGGGTLDEIAGLPDRYVSKLEAGMKIPGRLSLPLLLQSLGLKLVIVADDEAIPAVAKRFVNSLKPPPQIRGDDPPSGIHDGVEL